MDNVTVLAQEQAALIAKMHSIVRKARDEKRENLNTEENAEWTATDKAQEDLGARIDLLKKEERTNSLLTGLQAPAQNIRSFVPTKRHDENAAKDAFKAWALWGSEHYDQRAHAAALELGINPACQNLSLRTLTTSSAAGFIQAAPMTDFEKVLKAFGGVPEVSTLWHTPNGNSKPYPTFDDTSNSGSWQDTAEGDTFDATHDATVGAGVTFHAIKAGSGTMKVSVEELQDSAFDLEALISSAGTERIWRRINNQATVGAGGGSVPRGCVVASTLGVNLSGATLSWTHLNTLEHAIDPAYRNYQQCRFMFNDATLKTLKTIVDGNSRPLFLMDPYSFAQGQKPTILGYQYSINQDMAIEYSGNKFILFGRFDAGVLRLVNDIVAYRLVDSGYADKGLVGLGFYVRYWYDVVNDAKIYHLKK